MVHNSCYTQHDPYYPQHNRTIQKWQWTIWNQTNKYFHISQLKGLKRMRRTFYSHYNRSTRSMRREVLALLSNEKATYIEFQGDLWVTLTFGFSYSQSVPWNFLFLFYINSENMKTLHIPLLCNYMKIYSYFNSPNEN